MASERSHPVTGRRSATGRPANAEAKAQPLFGTKIRSTLADIKELREARRGDRTDVEPEPRPLFGNHIRETFLEVAGYRERRRAAKGVARGD